MFFNFSTAPGIPPNFVLVASVFTLGSSPTRRKQKRDGAKLAIGECKYVGRKGGRCEIELCRTGEGRTGYAFTKGSSRCGRSR